MNASVRSCPACGAEQPPASVVCEYCGSQILPVALSFQEREQVNRLAKRLNAYLEAEENRLLRLVEIQTAAVWVMGTGLLLVLWLGIRLFSNGWIFTVIYSMLCLGLRLVLRRRWAANRFIRFFRQEIEPQIRQFTLQTRLPRWQFDQMASFVINETAPLGKFLKVKPAAGDIKNPTRRSK